MEINKEYPLPPKFGEALLPQELTVDFQQFPRRCVVGLLKSGEKAQERNTLLPDFVEQLVEHHVSVFIEKDYGNALKINDLEYIERGAEVFELPDIIKSSDIFCKCGHLTLEELQLCKERQRLLVFADIWGFKSEMFQLLAEKKLYAFGYNFVKDEQEQFVYNHLLAHPDAERSCALLGEFLLPMVISLAFNQHLRSALLSQPALLQSIFCYEGIITNEALGKFWNVPFKDILRVCWNWR